MDAADDWGTFSAHASSFWKSPRLMNTDKPLVWAAPVPSVTLKNTVVGPPALEGIPVIVPVEALRFSPSGKLPDAIDQM